MAKPTQITEDSEKWMEIVNLLKAGQSSRSIQATAGVSPNTIQRIKKTEEAKGTIFTLIRSAPVPKPIIIAQPVQPVFKMSTETVDDWVIPEFESEEIEELSEEAKAIMLTTEQLKLIYRITMHKASHCSAAVMLQQIRTRLTQIEAQLGGH